MFYVILEEFGPAKGESWTAYLQWRGLILSGFDSVDGILRPSLFTPRTEEDWRHVVQADFMSHLITDQPYASSKHADLNKGALVGLSLDDHKPLDDRFLGFDIVDRFFQVSLLTNWGNDVACVNRAIGPCGLISEFDVVRGIQAELVASYTNDAHVDRCRIVSVYKTAPAVPGGGGV
jgi:hypothetical protein